MTYPYGPLPDLYPEQEALFAAAAATYARYRPGLPDTAAHLLADVLRGRPSPVLLDLGTGTGQVPLALLSAGALLTHIEAVDVNGQMLHQTGQALRPLLGDCTLTLAHAVADDYEPLATLPGEPDSGPDLITCCRSYHWMNGSAVLEMADRVATPGGAVAIMSDGSLWTHDADWTRALREVIQHYLGPERRAGARSFYAPPRRRFEEDLASSAFSDVTEHLFPVTRTWAPQEVLGYLRTTSFAGQELFAERHRAFEDEALALLHAHAAAGALVEETTFRVLLARRPGDA
ncbi:methyltransferase domain-containing protein (plasmid) [Streptomyces sp. BB1-1-1]|uniref:class I SAM-dependent methyltransferase n=1 Tax=Streptomyces sp. BB1-1-1 TaxID=3074430 RepID=UPI002877AE4D|nr:methyltransferase domain-containing protein [Streptomyces sp. BB1-1-1]WND40745.1 methyltransferase domain-containing protein [Streptomyces sp. BB1-1-1]